MIRKLIILWQYITPLIQGVIFPWEAVVSMKLNPLSANPTKWSNTLKQFVGCWRRLVLACLTILWGWRLKGNRGVFRTLTKSVIEFYFFIIDVWNNPKIRIWYRKKISEYYASNFFWCHLELSLIYLESVSVTSWSSCVSSCVWKPGNLLSFNHFDRKTKAKLFLRTQLPEKRLHWGKVNTY